MSSHVVVIDSKARRTVVKVTPAKHLSDVLGEACSRLGVDPSQYGLKHQKKQVDLSLSIRLAGLSSGAKLELVQLSRSPSLVSVGIQLPEADAQGVPNGRLVDKFPSSTTLWLVLRKFESGVAGNGTTRNLTARAVPTPYGESGAGRLFYQTPIIQVMDRELSSFTDLQKSLAQLGFNSGSALLRLSFRTTDRPLEDAMAEIDAYFKSVDSNEPGAAPSNQTPSSVETEAPATSSEAAEATPKSTSSDSGQPTSEEPSTKAQQPPPEPCAPTTEPSQPPLVSSRPVTVYAPPSGTTPQSAQTPYNERDYVPTVEHAKSHQRRLNLAGRPGRLASDKELASQESALQEKLANITEIEVKVRFPDQSQVVSKFGSEDTSSELYGFVRSCLDERLMGELFSLWFLSGSTASTSTSQSTKSKTVIPDSNETTLIRDLRMEGRVLVNFVWERNAAFAAKSVGTEILRPDLRKSAGQIKVEDLGATSVHGNETESKSWLQSLKGDGGDGGNGSSSGPGGGAEKKIPKWLKLPGKK